MKDFGNSDGRPHREDTDGSQEGQPAYKAFAKDKRTRITTSRPVEKVDYRREGHEPAEGARYDGEHRRPQEYRSGSGYAGSGRYGGGSGGDSGDASNRNRTEGGYRPRERAPYEQRGEGGSSDRSGYRRNSYDTRTYPSDGRPQGPSGEGAARRKSYNPNFDEYNRPVGRNRYDSSRDTEGGERRSGGYRRPEGGFEGGSRYGNDRSQEGRPERYAPRYGHGEGERGEGKEPREYAGGRPYGRSEGGERRYGDGKRPYGERGTGDRKGYGSKPYGTQGGGAYGGRPTDRRRPAGQRGPKVPKYNSENYPTFPAPVIEDKIRLNRYIAMSGICSRREADEFIQSGVVSVNGLVVTELGAKVSQQDEVRFNGNVIRNERKVYIVMNKPKGYVTSVEDPHADKTVMELLKEGCRERVYPVGRLDKNSLGVLLITNDGDMAKKLMHPSFEKKKVYQVSLDKPLTHADMDALVQGFELDDGEIHADAVSYVGTKKTEIGIEIHSGRNRIVRRMFEHLGYKVTKLDRVYFAGLTKQRLKRGEWRFLTPREVQALRSGQYE